MGRKINFREPGQSILIVCEGKETEPLYFNAFHISGVAVKGVGKNTLSLVKEAIKLREQGEYDQVWVVFDKEDYSADQVNDAIHLAEQNNFQVAFSNQKFEIWYLLHFHYFNTSMDRKEYDSKLSECLGFEYFKNRQGLYKQLLNRQSKAIERAKQLMEKYDPPNPCQDDPSTTVFRLVEELNRFSPDSRRSAS